MMNSDSSYFSTILDEENIPFSPDQHAMGALLGFAPIDQTEGLLFSDYAFSTPSLNDFPEQYPVQVDLPVSPGDLSSLPSLPSSPSSFGDDLSDLSVSDAYNSDLSPTGPAVFIPLAHVDEVRPARPYLAGFEQDPVTRKWVCKKCEENFVSTHEARRHVKTAAKCTGKKVVCLRCGDHIHASQWSRKRHFASKKCQKKGRKRGTPAYTVNNAYVEEL